MFKNTPQTGCLPLLNSSASKPLAFWTKQVRSGRIKRVQDDDLVSPVIEIVANNIRTTFITCPRDPLLTLGIRLPVIVLQLKNIGKYISFDLQVLDDTNVRRRFRATSMTCSTQVRPLVCKISLRMTDGWNNIQINLVDLTQRAYATRYVEATRLQVTANCRVRRIYFADRFHNEADMSAEWNWDMNKLPSPLRGSIVDQRAARSIFDKCPPITLSSSTK